MTKTPAEQVVKALMAKRRVWRERAAHQFSNGDFVQTLLQYNRSARFSPAALMSDEGAKGRHC